jgi:hypothetical protein
MSISNKAINQMARALTPEVIEALFSSDEYIEFMMDNVPVILEDKMGEMDTDFCIELSQCIMDNINLTARLTN